MGVRRGLILVAVLCVAVFAYAQLADGATQTTNINIGDTRIVHCRNNGQSVVQKNNANDGQVSCVAPTTSTTTSTTTTTTTTTTLPPGGFPDATNTGVPAGTTLTNVTGDLVVSAAGTTVDAKNVSGRIYVNADNVTITRTRATGGVTAHRGSGQRTTISDSDFGPSSGRWDQEGVDIWNTTILRSSIHNFPDGIRSNGGNVIQDNWIHNLSIIAGDHNDGIQRYAPGTDNGNGFTERVVHNEIDCVGCTTSGMFYADDWRGTLIVDNNRVRGGGYAIRLHESGTVVAFTNNQMLDYSGGPCSMTFSNIQVWSGNTKNGGAAVPPGSC